MLGYRLRLNSVCFSEGLGGVWLVRLAVDVTKVMTATLVDFQRRTTVLSFTMYKLLSKSYSR